MAGPCYTDVPLTNPSNPSFRVLRLDPGRIPDPLSCTLHTLSTTDTSLSYEAISYVWGIPTDKAPIICNSHPLLVTVNLHSVLEQLRLPTKPRYLWADAICINQQDVRERSHQVQLMGAIFHNAAAVVCWLGPESNDSAAGFQLAAHLADTYHEYLAAGGAVENLSLDDERARRCFERFTLSAEHPRLRAFAGLARRPWFHRLWVVQELALARKVAMRCGELEMRWEDFVAAVTVQDHLSLHMADNNANANVFILERAREDWQRGRRLSLLSVLHRFHTFESTDPRDKILGITALAEERAMRSLNTYADYTQSTEAMYRMIAVQILREEGLDILSFPRRFLGGDPYALPSWVPDWSWTRLSPCLGLTNFSSINDLAFSACGGPMPPHIRFFDEKATVLGLQGVSVDYITAVGTIKTPPGARDKFNFGGLRIFHVAFLYHDWARVAGLRAGRRYHPTGEPLADAFVQTLGTRPTHEPLANPGVQYRIVRKYAIMAWWATLLRQLWAPELLVGWVVTLLYWLLFRDGPKQVSLEFRFAMSALTDRRMFRTRKGYIGIASALAEIGDRVFVVQGGKVPLVMREEGKRWRFRGDCYVRGIMSGEAWREEDKGLIWVI